MRLPDIGWPLLPPPHTSEMSTQTLVRTCNIYCNICEFRVVEATSHNYVMKWVQLCTLDSAPVKIL